MSWRHLYPFASHFHVAAPGVQMHYVDEGAPDAPPMLMLHGNPTWSFLFRKLIPEAAASGYRALAPDFVGYGLSDKPQKWLYTLERHIRTLEKWLEDLRLAQPLTLVCHDWGGPIGMGYAVRHPEKIGRLVLMNTAAFLSDDCPWRIHLCRCPWLGELLVRGLNLFVPAATRLAPAKPLPPEVREGYLHPYRNWHDRIGPLSFIRDLPLRPADPSWNAFRDIQEKLPLFRDRDIRLLWGEKDFCIHTGFLRRWKEEFYPGAQVFRFPEAGHYLLEDSPREILPIILRRE